MALAAGVRLSEPVLPTADVPAHSARPPPSRTQAARMAAAVSVFPTRQNLRVMKVKLTGARRATRF